MLAAAALAAVAIVAHDQASLRAAPRDSAAQHALLTQGDLLEIRGRRLDYLHVYDHRRERAGYIRASQVRPTSLKPEEAPALLAVLRFLRDSPGSEALGIAYAAAYLKAAPAEAITAEPFDALGGMAERLARRASTAQGKAAETAAAHREAAAQYGVKFNAYERADTIRLCYDGEAFRRVLALAADADQRARAALALTRDDCIDPALPPIERPRFDQWRAQVLDRVDATQFARLDGTVKNRLRLRRAGVWSSIAFQQAHKAQLPQAAAQRALDELAGVDKAELTDDDQAEYDDAAMRVGASRWAAAEAAPAQKSPLVESPLTLATEPGAAGETCVSLTDSRPGAAQPLARRCTYGVAWTASVSASPKGDAMALAVQPLDGWRELWLFRRQADGWHIDVLPPAASAPGLGYVEFAGWVPGVGKLLLAREARVDGRHRRSFEVATLDGLVTEKQAGTPGLLALFGKWQDPAWKRGTVSLR